jgi:hypothetical protein
LAAPASYPITASFGGDAANLPSAASSSIAITKAATTLTPLSSGLGATLASAGKPLTQESVRFSVNAPQGLLDVYAITDYLGRATLPPPGIPVGTYTVTAGHFDGNATYASSDLTESGSFQGTSPYAFVGFYSPIENPPAGNSAKAGSSIPVKFGLGGNRGLQVLAAGFPVSQPVSCSTLGAIAASAPTASAGSSSLQYDSSADQYSYIWKTDKSWAGTCRSLVIRFVDGTQRSANFRFN